MFSQLNILKTVSLANQLNAVMRVLVRRFWWLWMGADGWAGLGWGRRYFQSCAIFCCPLLAARVPYDKFDPWVR